jgi:hypothetical protein
MDVIFSVARHYESLKDSVNKAMDNGKLSPEIQSIGYSVGELGKSLIQHEMGAFVLDTLGFSGMAWLIRQRGQWSFWLRATLLLALSPPYLAKNYRQEEGFEIIETENVRRIPGVVERGCRDIININALHVVVLMLGAQMISVGLPWVLNPQMAKLISCLAQAYVQGHFLAQYPLATKERLTPSSVIHQLAGKSEWIFAFGLLSVLGRLCLNEAPLIGPALVLLWNLALILLAFECRDIASPLGKEPAKTWIDPGLQAWNGVNALVTYLSVPQGDPAGVLWGRRVKGVIDSPVFRSVHGWVMSEPCLQGIKLTLNGLGFFKLSDALPPSAHFISQHYAELFWNIGGVIASKETQLERTQRILNSTVGGYAFSYLGRPFLRWRYGKVGAVSFGVVATDFVLTVYPGIKPQEIVSAFQTVAERLSPSILGLEREFDLVDPSLTVKEPVEAGSTDEENDRSQGRIVPFRIVRPSITEAEPRPELLPETGEGDWASVRLDSVRQGRVAIVTTTLGAEGAPKGNLLEGIGSIFPDVKPK